MGAVTNVRPDLFRAVHAAVPFVDVMNTMMDASLPLTVGEYLEWGNPNEKAAFDYMLSYSPYDNLAKKAYPAHPRHHELQRQPGDVLGAGEVRGEAADAQDRREPARSSRRRCSRPATAARAAATTRCRDRAFEIAWMLKQVGITK